MRLAYSFSTFNRIGVGSDGRVQCFINNEFVNCKPDTQTIGDYVTNPATQEILATTPNTSIIQINHAIQAAANAFPQWRHLPISKRARYLFKLDEVIRRDMDEIAHILTEEQGKTLTDARGDISRGLDVVENMISAPNVLKGSTCSNVVSGLDVSSYREPLGVCVGITPFNFPAMIGLWIWPTAIVAGNTFIWKPSPKVPLTAMKLGQVCRDIGLPPGVLNIVHGQEEAVKHLCSHRDVEAISFVGGNVAGRAIYEMAGKHGKRAQCNMGAKNHAVVLEDVDPEKSLTAVCNAAFGAAGQRCMALAVVILVGKASQWESKLVQISKKFRVGSGIDPKSDLGPMITSSAKDKAMKLCRDSVENFGAKFLVDGTNVKVDGYPNGNFLAPTILTDITTETPAYKIELFAPTLCVIKVSTLDEAIKIVNSNPYGNGCALFTQNGAAARRFVSEVQVGQIGINLPVPVPPPMFSFTGWKESFAGDLNVGGTNGLLFFTKTKNILGRWDESQSTNQICGDFQRLR